MSTEQTVRIVVKVGTANTAAERRELEKLIAEAQAMAEENGEAISVDHALDSIAYRKNSENTVEIDKIEDKLKELREEVVHKKRRYLKKENWVDPEQSSQSEVNRSTKKLSPRVSESHASLFDQVAKTRFPNKREALEHAIELLAAEADPPADPSLE